jgi:hypothetical protein
MLAACGGSHETKVERTARYVVQQTGDKVKTVHCSAVRAGRARCTVKVKSGSDYHCTVFPAGNARIYDGSCFHTARN